MSIPHAPKRCERAHSATACSGLKPANGTGRAMGALGSLRGRGIGRPACRQWRTWNTALPRRWGRARSAGPRRASPRAGIRARRPGFPRAWASRSSIGRAGRTLPVRLVLSGREIPYGRARGGGSRRKASVRPSTAAKPQRMARARRRPDGLAHGLRRRRSPWAHGWRGRRCRRAAPDISRRPGRIDPGRPGRMRRAVAQRSSTPRQGTQRASPLASPA